jgi:hypothetical protein
MPRIVEFSNPDRDTLGIDFDHQATDFTKPPYTSLQINNGQSKRGPAQHPHYLPRQSAHQQPEQSTGITSAPRNYHSMEPQNSIRPSYYDPEVLHQNRDTLVSSNVQFPASYTNSNPLVIGKGFSFADPTPTLNHYMTYSSYPNASGSKPDYLRSAEKHQPAFAASNVKV